MKLSWRSRKGNRSRTNNDAMGCYQDNAYLVAVVVDASEKGPEGEGHALARFWAGELIRSIRYELENGNELSTRMLYLQIKKAHQKLRPQYLCAIASYTVLSFNKHTRELLILYCGDCLVAIESPNDERQWLIDPHHCSHQQGLESPLFSASRNILTRCLKARRFEAPTVMQTNLCGHSRVLVCTDGYWAEHLASQQDWIKLEDDASVLLISPSEHGCEYLAESDNGFFQSHLEPA
ncbi:hypothetical protein [Oceanisphaera sp. IT1-181]|uniref:hypothetical protein n=1 Tax=Oceanisphaera sp. IT1-181 TaxID=3081199 RepID=UPI0029C9E81C|nr:hypothetical protein [Oceanisphaera sp. IT1-181]